MTVFTGFIAKINSKDGRTKSGKPWTLWSIKLENADGTQQDKWLSAGFDKPTAAEGDYVEIIAEENEKGYLDVKGIKQVKNAPARGYAPGVAKVVAGGDKASSSDVRPHTTTQTSIHYQSARKDAVAVLALLIEKDALPISKAKDKSGEAKRYEEIMALVDKITVRYFQDAETHRILDSVVDEGTPQETNDGNSEEADEKDE